MKESLSCTKSKAKETPILPEKPERVIRKEGFKPSIKPTEAEAKKTVYMLCMI